MRTLTAAEQQLLNPSGGRRELLRVKVKDAGATFRDLTSYPGMNFVVSASWKESVDSDGLDCDVSLKREDGLDWEFYNTVSGNPPAGLSLAPLRTSSPLNLDFNPAGAYAPLLAPGREIQVETAIVPLDSTPAAGDWKLVFHGYVDNVDSGSDPITIQCRDLSARIKDTYIEEERVYSYAQGVNATKGCRLFAANTAYALNDLVLPSQGADNGHFYKVTTGGTTAASGGDPAWPTGSGAPVSNGGVTFTEAGSTSPSAGTAVETVIQQLLTEWMGGAAPTLYVPVSPAWAIKWYLQQRTNVFDACRALVEQIGWDLRYKWDNGTSAWRLTLYQPNRTASVADATFSARGNAGVTTPVVRDVRALRQSLETIRNVVRVIFSDSADLDGSTPKRKIVEVSDSASITAYGRRWMEVAEASSSNIDTTVEATAMANAILADLKNSNADFEVEVPLYPAVQLGDYYTFASPFPQFDVAQSFGVVSYSHNHGPSGASTVLTLAGKPSGGVFRWLAKDGRINAVDVHVLNPFNATGAVLAQGPVVGGTRLSLSETLSKQALPGGHEFHVSASNGFAPSSSTKVGTSFNGHSVVIPDLVPGKQYYARAVPLAFNAGRIARAPAGPQLAFTAGRASAGHYHSVVSQAHFPLNGNFEHALDDLATVPPDHWALTQGSWGASSDAYYGTDAVYGRYISLRQTGGDPNLRSSPWPVRRGMGHCNVYLSVRQTGTPAAGRGLVLYFRFYSLADLSDSPTLYTFTVPNAYAAVNTWATYVIDSNFFGALPVQANFCTLTFGKEAISSAYGWDVGDVFFEPGEQRAWYVTNLYPTTIAVESWIAPTYANSWANFGGGYLNGGYCKDPMGFVHLRGEIKRSSGVAVDGETIFNLPTGYRPSGQVLFPVAANVSGGYVEITTGGNLIWRNTTGQNWLQLDGITFDTR